MADQSLFVRAAVNGVIREAIIAACLTGRDDSAVPGKLAQHADHRRLDSAVDSDLDLRAERAGRNDQHHDAGRAGAGGRHPGGRRHGGDREHRPQSGAKARNCATAILDGAAQIAVPALVSTLCICIVFLPMFFLTGVARYLFIPLAEAVVFAMLASYLLSRTLVPTLAMYLLQAARARAKPSPRWNLAGAVSAVRSSAAFERLRDALSAACWQRCVHRRGCFVPAVSGGVRGGVSCWCRGWARISFPTTDAGQFQSALARQDRHAHRGDGARSATRSRARSGA